MTVSTAQLIGEISAGDLSDVKVEATYQALTQSLLHCFLEEDSVAIPGFGTFTPEKQEEYVADDPVSGHRMLFPPNISLTYQPSVLLRKKITG